MAKKTAGKGGNKHRSSGSGGGAASGGSKKDKGKGKKNKNNSGVKVVTNSGNKVKVHKQDMKSNYDTLDSVSGSLSDLRNALNIDASLDTSNPFDFMVDRAEINRTMDDATNAAYLQKMREAQQAYNQAEDSNYTNTQNTINEMRRNLVGSASSGANVGAANATALQAILGLGQQNAAGTTQGMQAVQNVAGEKAAALAQNAADAIDRSNSAKQMQGQLATDKYSADKSAAATRAASAAEAVGQLSSTIDTNNTNVGMNNATNMTNLGVAEVSRKTKNTTRSKNKNINVNKNK